MLCLCDRADVKESSDVSAGSSWISVILHVRAKNIACVRNMALVFAISQYDGEGGMHLLRVVEYCVGILDS